MTRGYSRRRHTRWSDTRQENRTEESIMEGWPCNHLGIFVHFRGCQHGTWAPLVAQMVKNLLAMWETWVQFLGLEDSSGGGDGNPLQYSSLEIPTDRAGWQATVLGGHKKSDTTEWLALSLFSMEHLWTACFYLTHLELQCYPTTTLPPSLLR